MELRNKACKGASKLLKQWGWDAKPLQPMRGPAKGAGRERVCAFSIGLTRCTRRSGCDSGSFGPNSAGAFEGAGFVQNQYTSETASRWVKQCGLSALKAVTAVRHELEEHAACEADEGNRISAVTNGWNLGGVAGSWSGVMPLHKRS